MGVVSAAAKRTQRDEGVVVTAAQVGVQLVFHGCMAKGATWWVDAGVMLSLPLQVAMLGGQWTPSAPDGCANLTPAPVDPASFGPR